MIEIIGIKTNNGYYITDNTQNKSYYGNLRNKVINSEPIETTFHNSWFKVKSEPKKVQEYVNQPPINKRFELINKDLSDKLQEVYLWEDVFVERNNDYENIFTDEFTKIKPLYEFKQEEQPPILKDIEFSYHTIVEIDEIKTPNGFKYKRAGKWNNEKYMPITEKDLKYDMISQIITPDILLPQNPCKLSQKETYDIIRAYVKDNINPRFAEITSDYDFCFTVVKKIKLAKEHIYQVDVNNNIFSKKRKPKYETRIQKTRTVKVFEMCHKPYQDYTPIKHFEADNQDDMKETIDNYLSHLISVINEPLCDCDKCGGTGVLLINELNKTEK